VPGASTYYSIIPEWVPVFYHFVRHSKRPDHWKTACCIDLEIMCPQLSLFLIAVLATSSFAISTSASSTISTQRTSTMTAFPITRVGHYIEADTCVQSYATYATSIFSSSLSCASVNPAPCLCQSITQVAALAHSCASVSHPAPATDSDIEAIGAKMIILATVRAMGKLQLREHRFFPAQIS
jgi:hypothetical protein